MVRFYKSHKFLKERLAKDPQLYGDYSYKVVPGRRMESAGRGFIIDYRGEELVTAAGAKKSMRLKEETEREAKEMLDAHPKDLFAMVETVKGYVTPFLYLAPPQTKLNLQGRRRDS
mgnify:CR=1 FL=1